MTDCRTGAFHAHDSQSLLHLRAVWQRLDMPHWIIRWLSQSSGDGTCFYDDNRHFKRLSYRGVPRPKVLEPGPIRKTRKLVPVIHGFQLDDFGGVGEILGGQNQCLAGWQIRCPSKDSTFAYPCSEDWMSY